MTRPESELPATEGTDCVQAFALAGEGIDEKLMRGRCLRLGPALDEILGRHDYPPLVANLLAETLALAAILAATLKYDGIFTLQTKGDGPVRLLVADVTSTGALRGYAQFDAAAIAALGPGPASLPHILGAGYLAFTVDQGEHSERYQGIVELTGADLVECVQHYFRQSEQIATGFNLKVRKGEKGWRAGAILLQRLPLPERALHAEAWDLAESTAEAIADSWIRAIAFLASAKSEELIGPEPGMAELLYRLFHEMGIRANSPTFLRAECRCSAARVERVLKSLPAMDLADILADGATEVTCEFCAATYRFAAADLYGEKTPS